MKPKIIIVEDEVLIAHDIRQILEEDEQYDVINDVTSVDDAIRLIEIHNPVLVLIDIKLNQDKEGVELGKYLLDKDLIPFIYITSYSDKATMDKVFETRPCGFIVKPFKTSDIKSTVAVVINNYKYRKIDVVRSEKAVENNIPFRIKECVNYIDMHITERIEISKLSEITKWGKHHFIRLFTQYMGVTPYQYILSKKVEKAKVLLLDDSISLSDIAFDLGFNGYSNFANAFKKVTLLSPEKYRKKNKAYEFLKK